MPEVCWLPHIVKSTSFSFSERLSQKLRKRAIRRWAMLGFSLWLLHEHARTHIGEKERDFEF